MKNTEVVHGARAAYHLGRGALPPERAEPGDVIIEDGAQGVVIRCFGGCAYVEWTSGAAIVPKPPLT